MRSYSSTTRQVYPIFIPFTWAVKTKLARAVTAHLGKYLPKNLCRVWSNGEKKSVVAAHPHMIGKLDGTRHLLDELSLDPGVTNPISDAGVFEKINYSRSSKMQFMVLGKYSNQGLAGFLQIPNDDRIAAISSMMEKAGGKLIDLHLTRGEYDIVAIGEVDSFEDIAAVKLLVASSGAVDNLTILEMIDMNSIANKAAAITGSYRAPGS